MSIVKLSNNGVKNATAFGSAVTSLGSMIFIKKLTASSSATLSFVDGSSDVVLDDTYKEYLFTFNNIHLGTAAVNNDFKSRYYRKDYNSLFNDKRIENITEYLYPSSSLTIRESEYYTTNNGPPLIIDPSIGNNHVIAKILGLKLLQINKPPAVPPPAPKVVAS